ncbi:hypothetical protein [Stenotrophomonas maltophilia]|uniref:hypothetical protein n=1 Tax=Stenotrophomonas maltophilia TaxID=40324 RepID=UPI0012FD3BC2|nr:hypothetical protein [Stenotrophomonas maltophilia]
MNDEVKSGNKLFEAAAAFQDVRKERDEHLKSDRPSAFMKDEYKAWTEKSSELSASVESAKEKFFGEINKASPEDIERLQGKMKENMEVQNSQRKSFSQLLSARREQEGDSLPFQLSEVEDEWKNRNENRARIRTSHGREDYAATAQSESDYWKAHQKKEDAYMQAHLGSGQPTLGQVEDWHREQQKQQRQKDVSEVRLKQQIQ